MNVLLGKRDIAKTFNVVKDLVWDSDVTIEGATLQYGKDVSGKQKSGPSLIAGYYTLENYATASDPCILPFRAPTWVLFRVLISTSAPATSIMST